MSLLENEFLKNIIDGWNERLNFNNIELSSLVPFVELYVLWDESREDGGNDPKYLRNNQPIVNLLRSERNDDIVDITLNNSVGMYKHPSYYVGLPIGKLESQTGSRNQKGGVGINSLNVSRGTRESYVAKYNLNLTITDTTIFRDKIEITSLYNLNQQFLLIYGWSGSKSGTFLQAPTIENNSLEVDLNKNEKGFWLPTLVNLQKFRFSLEQNGHLAAELTFLTSGVSKLAYKRAQEITKLILRDLQQPSIGDEGIESLEKLNRDIRSRLLGELQDDLVSDAEARSILQRNEERQAVLDALVEDASGEDVETETDDEDDDAQDEINTEVTGINSEQENIYDGFMNETRTEELNLINLVHDLERAMVVGDLPEKRAVATQAVEILLNAVPLVNDTDVSTVSTDWKYVPQSRGIIADEDEDNEDTTDPVERAREDVFEELSKLYPDAGISKDMSVESLQGFARVLADED